MSTGRKILAGALPVGGGRRRVALWFSSGVKSPHKEIFVMFSND